MKLFDEFWEAWKYDPASIDEAFEQCFKAGMLAVAGIVPNNYTQAEWRLVIENAIRMAENNGND